MEVEYAYCPHCGMEWTDEITLEYIGKNANGDFVRCPECRGSIGSGNYTLTQKQSLENNNLDSDFKKALEMAEAGGYDGAHHKQWVIDQMVRILAGNEYPFWVKAHERR